MTEFEILKEIISFEAEAFIKDGIVKIYGEQQDLILTINIHDFEKVRKYFDHVVLLK